LALYENEETDEGACEQNAENLTAKNLLIKESAEENRAWEFLRFLAFDSPETRFVSLPFEARFGQLLTALDGPNHPFLVSNSFAKQIQKRKQKQKQTKKQKQKNKQTKTKTKTTNTKKKNKTKTKQKNKKQQNEYFEE
jgi:hypothetical protein